MRMKPLLKRMWLFLRLSLILLLFPLVIANASIDETTPSARIWAAARGHSFNYVNWEINALLSKARQELTGVHSYIPPDEKNEYVLAYFDDLRALFLLDSQLQNAPESDRDALLIEYTQLEADLQSRQALVEHIIEGQVSEILRDAGFAMWGQVLPPVTMRFLDIPDVLVVSPRNEIRQTMTLTLNPMNFEERVALESDIARAVPDQSVWITPIGGVGIYPAMITQTDRAVVAYEIVAHEWAHHYLVFFPLGLEYFNSADTRIINETTATILGDEIGNRVIQHFYPQALAAGRVYLQEIPDYRQLLAGVTGGLLQRPILDAPLEGDLNTANRSAGYLVDFLMHQNRPEAAQVVLDQRRRFNATFGWQPPANLNANRPAIDRDGWVNHARVGADYLLVLGRVEGAELWMERARESAGLRVLNQAWFAFNVGYQANPVIQTLPDGTTALTTSGGGGDPIGPAMYEVRARAGSLQDFMQIMRGITTREELFKTLAHLRGN